MQNPTSPPPPAPPSSSSFSSTFFNLRDPKPKPTLILLYTFLFLSLLSLTLILYLSHSTIHTHSGPDPFLHPTHAHRLVFDPHKPSPPPPPAVAYLISGSRGDAARILRLLNAVYHPLNVYLLHLDASAPHTERELVAVTVQSNPIFKAAQNVHVVGKPDFSYPKGSSPVSLRLHAASVLLRLSRDWDWFVSLSADAYPLVTQDDLLHILSFLPKDLNFVNHSSYIGWKEARKLKPIIVDPGLYLSEGSEMFYATQKRELPSAYRLFTGSSFSILSRRFMEFCILGEDNLPRILLMYFANTPSSLSNYFPTVLCNSRQFNRTVINKNLLYSVQDSHRNDVRPLNSTDFDDMIQSGAIFGEKFQKDDPVLDLIDRNLLGRTPRSVVPGGWCLGEPGNNTCLTWGDAKILRPGAGSQRLEKAIVELLANGIFRSRQCIYE
ncbi:beta-glucuronosyltransferase GlcAT14B [Vigna radiata var. radiata]|uniref:Beta-glucuronosyltransferase GlcAT14B n=1 Tax=Vigna radiata var. radiata TaxID=3916 RepID=A0A1S3UYL8_VIGRR|nr:beta-glucuronosyltransferase GlcAT14B [Vigna radiata var. radiata]